MSACSALCRRAAPVTAASSLASVCKTRSSSGAIKWERLRDRYTTDSALRARGRKGASSGGENVGGIVGQIDNNSAVSLSWFAGDVVGDVAGGLAGEILQNTPGAIVDSWAMARVRGATAGGLFGSESLNNSNHDRAGRNSWAGGVVLGSVATAGGVSGSSTGGMSVTVYWDVETSGQDSSPGAGAGGHIGVTLTVAAAVTLPPAIWSHTNGAYPTLLAHDADLQGAAILAGLTRLMAIENGDPALTLQVGEENLVFGESTLRLDINGANPLQDAVCSIDDDGALVAADVVNGASAFLLPPAGKTFSLVAGGVGCEAQVDAQGVESLTMRFSAGAATLARVYRIESDLDVLRAAYLAAIGPDTARWLEDDDGDDTINAYDDSPRRGIFLFDEEVTYGGADNPWPVYNIWQLQAIDGVVPAEATTGLLPDAASASQAAGQTLYGADSNARLGASYRLEVDIDATPTRNWDGGSGFDPIAAFGTGNRFVGVFDGGGNVVRGLHIDRAGQNNIGLFAAVDDGAARVVNLGLDDARITGGNRVGAIAGSIDSSSEVRAVWARGRVQGGVTVGGLVGDAISGNLMESWFAGQVEGDNRVGGLAGSGSVFTLEDSWAAVDIVAPAGMRAGELVGDGNFIGIPGNLRRLWGEGYLSSADFLASGAALDSVHTVGIRALDAADLNAPIWNVGMGGADGDFPILTVHSESTQGAAIAYGLTRVMRADDTPFVLSLEETALVGDSPTIIFDINGDDDAVPACDPGVDGAFATGYNNATISVSFPTEVSPAAAGVCGYVLQGFTSGEMTLTVSFMSGGDSIAREYPLSADQEAASMAFFEAVEADPANWLLDPDRDGVISAYDYEPLGKSILTLRAENANGEAGGEPIPIYNVWQLQAIGGRVPSDASAAIAAIDSDGLAAAMTLFGENAERLSLRYRLATVIDARPTREWTDGFAAIVGESDEPFSGELDGGGRSIRGLSVGMGGGLFDQIESSGRVLDLGFENVIVESDSSAGAVAGRVESGATLVSVWAYGRVVVSGDDASENAGGLVGDLLGDIEGSWFAGDVSSSAGNAGGLAGNAEDGAVRTSWASAEVEAALGAGGLAGTSTDDFGLEDSWAVGLPRSSDSTLAGGLIGDGVASANVLRSFWDISASGLEARDDEAGEGVNSLASLPITRFDTAVSDRFDGGTSRYPVLSGTNISKARQRAAILFGLTRVFSGTVRLAASGLTRLPLHEIEVDLNGAAANVNCNISNNFAQLSTLIYAGADLRLKSENGCFARPESSEQFSSETRVLTIEFTTSGGEVTLRAEREIAYDGQTARAYYIANTDWTAEALLDDDGDMTINVYDWTPLGEASNFDLRVSVNFDLRVSVTMDGSKNRPYPVYNIWQLQAIDGVAPDDVPADMRAAGQTLYGADSTARLTASYRLEFDIDATPTRDWNSGSGFDPIGGSFSGMFDGGGNVVRGLRINSVDSTVGLFAEISSSGGRVQDVGLENARVNGVNSVGAIAGSLGDGGELRSVWVHGRVTGGSQVGGLAGSNVNSTITSSWFAGQVRGGDLVGGLAGTVSASNARVLDSWAAVDIVATVTLAGELVGEITGGGLSRLWGEGFFSPTIRSSGGNPQQVYYDDIRAQTHLDFGDASIWNVGETVDFPILTVHSQNLQGAAIAAGLTRIIGVNGATTATLTLDASVEQPLNSDFAAMRLEANTGDVPALDCDFAEGALRAQTGFNGASVIMTVISAMKNWRLATRGGCDVNWVGGNSDRPVTLRLIFVSRANPGAPETRLTTDYLLKTTNPANKLDASPLFVSLPASATLPAFASAGAPALTVTVAGPRSGLDIYALAGGGFTVAQTRISTRTFLATVALARAATAIFASDNLTVDVILSLTHSGSATLAMVKFVSTPRPIHASPTTTVTVVDSQLAVDSPVLATNELLAIWHFNEEERYTLAGRDAALFVANENDGSVQVGANAIPIGFYEFELQLIGGGVTARRSINVDIIDAREAARTAFLSTVEWSAANAYAYEFVVNGEMVQLSVVNGVTMDGTAEKPWPIYNIWQLQAIASVSVNADDGSFSKASNLLGGNLNLDKDDYYQLMNDIDATVTRGWGAGQTLGFYPIPAFSGGFDGGGRVISSLYIKNNGDDVGLFAQISGGGRVASVGLDAARIVGGETSGIDNVGAIAGEVREGKMVEVWAIGRVESRGGRAGGLIGGDDGASAFSLERGWFAGEVVVGGGSDGEGGGLLGGGTNTATPQISDSWAMARVITGGSKGGGLVGEMPGNGALRRVWAGGAAAGGLIGEALETPTVEDAYWDESTSGQDSSAGGFGIGLETAQTLLASALTVNTWTAGDNSDYPILEGSDDWKNWQRLGLARGLTRLYGAINGGDSVPLTVDMTVTFSDTGALNARIDVNGEAALTPTCTAKSPAGDGWTVTIPKYNGVLIEFVAQDNDGNSIGTNSNSNCDISISGTEIPYTIVVTFTVEGDSPKTIERRYLITRESSSP